MRTRPLPTALRIPMIVPLVVGMAELQHVAHGHSTATAARQSAQPTPQTAATPGKGGLSAVAAASSDDVWAVGYQGTSGSSTFAEHWDGTTWTRAATPNPGSFAELEDVTIPPGTGAWAVGDAESGSRTLTLAEHWQGGHWVQTPSPTPGGSEGGDLLGVAGSGASDVWAVGFFTTGAGVTRPLVEHWNGKHWRVVADTKPTGSAQSALEDAVVISPTNAWAVGYAYKGESERSHTLVEHWNGHTWKRVASPNPNVPSRAGLYGVSGSSASDVTAVGRYDVGSKSTTITEHWNGHRWSLRKTPSPGGPGGSLLNGSDTDSSRDVWAVGSAGSGTLALRWKGSSWHRTPSPNVGDIGSQLTGVDAVAPGDAWSVGSHLISLATSRPLIEHWNGHRWTIAQR